MDASDLGDGKALKPRLAAMLGYVFACEQALLADLPAAEREAAGSPQRWNAHAILAHNSDFRREQVIRLRAAAAATVPPDFPQVNHADPEVYRAYADRGWPNAQAEAAGVVADMVIALDAVDGAQLIDPRGFPWLGGRQLWAQILVRGAWHPIGHLADYLVAHQRSDQAVATVEGVIRTASALGLPAAPGGIAMAVYTLAAVHAASGDRVQALKLLRDALADDHLLVPKSATEPDFDSLRTDPDFPVPVPS